jgi:hypothetical protein
LAAPAADPQDSALPADAAVEKGTSAQWAHRAARFADAPVPERSANSEPADAAHQALRRRSHQSHHVPGLFAQKKVSEHRPCPGEAAVAVPKESGLAWARALVSRESPFLLGRVRDSPGRESRAHPAQAARGKLPEPARAQLAQVAAREAVLAVEPHEAKVWTAARRMFPTTREAAAAEPGARVLPELLRSSFVASPSRWGRQSRPRALPTSARTVLPAAAREEARLPWHFPRLVPDAAKLQARRRSRRSPAGAPAELRRRRASWSASSCRQHPAPPTSRESR